MVALPASDNNSFNFDFIKVFSCLNRLFSDFKSFISDFKSFISVC